MCIVCMVGTKDRSQKSYVLDTCIGRRCYDNPAYLDMLKMRIDLEASKAVFTTVSIYEIDNKADYGYDDVKSRLEFVSDSKIGTEEISEEMNVLGIWLNEKIDGLHYPDNQILAFAMITGSILVTCDKGLERASRSVGHHVINPDSAVIDFVKTQSGLGKLARSKASSLKQKMAKPARAIKKPVTKIVWG